MIDTTKAAMAVTTLILIHVHRFRVQFAVVVGRDGQLHTSIYDKRDDFNFHITNFLFPSRPMACLSLILYDRPGLASHMNVLF